MSSRSCKRDRFHTFILDARIPMSDRTVLRNHQGHAAPLNAGIEGGKDLGACGRLVDAHRWSRRYYASVQFPDDEFQLGLNRRGSVRR